MEPTVHVRQLRRVFRVPEREAGLLAAMKSVVRRQYRDVIAVDGIDIEIERGGVVGFLGPNGAGKTTTLKMLSGLLHPTNGEVRVLGHEPRRRERAYLRQIALVMGNRNQLHWDIPAADSYELNRAIYQIGWPEFRRVRDELVELLAVGDLIRKPVRTLSLGERMKVEIVGCLIHLPKVLFLDEPTLGLDLTMQRRLRAFIVAYQRQYGATVLLTSHYMADVQALCPRILIIDRGRIRYDGGLAELSGRVASYQELAVTLVDEDQDLSPFGQVVSSNGATVRLRVPKRDAPAVTARLLAAFDVHELTVENPPVEDVIATMFAEPDQAGVPT